MLSKDSVRKNFSIVLQSEGQILGVCLEKNSRLILRLDLICGEEDSLAKEMCHNVVGAYELHFPLKRVQDVSLHNDELVIGERRLSILLDLSFEDVLQKLDNPWVGLLVIFG